MKLKTVDKFWAGIFIAALILAACFMVSDAHADLVYPTTDLTFKARTIYNDGNMAQPDSLLIMVTKAGAHLSSGWYNTGDAQCAADSAGLVFHDQLQDIDGAGGIGHYLIEVGAYDKDSSLYTWYYHYYTVGIIDTTTADTVNAILDTLQLYDGRYALAAELTKAIDSINGILDTLQLYDGRYALEASLFDNTSDSVIVDVSSAGADDGLCEAITDSVWDEVLTAAAHNVATSAGRRLRSIEAGYVIADGTAQRGDDSSIVLASATSEADDWFNSCVLVIAEGTGAGQARTIKDYTGATDSISLHVSDKWGTNPDATSEYFIVADIKGHVSHMHTTALDQVWEYDTANISGAQAVGSVLKDTAAYQAENVNVASVDADAIEAGDFKTAAIDADAIATSAIGAEELAANCITSSEIGTNAIDNDAIAANAIGASELATDAVDEIWEYDTASVSGAQAVGSVLKLLDSLKNYPARVDLIWDEVLATHTVNGSVGEVLLDSLDALVSSAGSALSDANMGGIADSVWDKAYADMIAQAGGAGDSLQAILNDLLDSIQNQDDWVATEVTAAKALDSLADVLDTLELYDTRFTAIVAQNGQIIDSLADVLDSLEAQSVWIQDSLYAILDTIQLYDGRYALAAELTKVIDSVNGILDTLQNYPARVDLVWDEILATHTTNGSVGEVLLDSLDALVSSAGSALSDANMGAIADSVWDKIYADMVGQAGGAGDSLWAILNDLLDTLQLYDGRYALEATVQIIDDSIDAWDDNIAEILDILDTLQNQDDWVATEVTAAKALDSLADILDTLESYDDWVATEATAEKALDSLADVLDTLENYDDWIATEATAGKALDSLADVLDSLELYDTRLDSLLAAAEDVKFERVWFDIDTTNIDTSEIGEWLVSAIVGQSGVGPVACTVLVTDGTDPIPYAIVRAYNNDRSSELTGNLVADANGKAFPWLTNGTEHDILSSATGYSTVLSDDYDPDSATLITVPLTAYSISSPPNAQTNQVYGHLRNAAGDTARYCPITFTLGCIGRNLCDSTILGGAKGEAALVIKTITDSDGDFQVPLVESHCWDCDEDGVSDTVMYNMQVEGVSEGYEFVVPDGDSYEIIWE